MYKRQVLGLAAGGGQQMPIFAALGAKCTVLDYSEKQLESERMVAQRESYDITIVRADMTKRLPFDDNSFDLIFHPVSNCYVYAVLPIWRECARVLKPGGRLLAGLDNGFNYALSLIHILRLACKDARKAEPLLHAGRKLHGREVGIVLQPDQTDEVRGLFIPLLRRLADAAGHGDVALHVRPGDDIGVGAQHGAVPALRDADLAGVRLFLPGQQLQEGALAADVYKRQGAGCATC